MINYYYYKYTKRKLNLSINYSLTLVIYVQKFPFVDTARYTRVYGLINNYKLCPYRTIFYHFTNNNIHFHQKLYELNHNLDIEYYRKMCYYYEYNWIYHNLKVTMIHQKEICP